MRRLLSMLCVIVALPACSTTPNPPGDGGVGVCVEDSRKPAGCQTSWEFVDSCGLAKSAASLQVVVFDKQCPPKAALIAGNTSLALQSQSVAPDQPFLPEQGLEQQPYGFAFLLRDSACHVMAWGCTTADLGAVTDIRTGVQNWEGQALCTAATSGGCTAPATCNAGVCK